MTIVKNIIIYLRIRPLQTKTKETDKVGARKINDLSVTLLGVFQVLRLTVTGYPDDLSA